MLRASTTAAGVELDLGAIIEPGRSTGVAGADEIVAFTRSLVGRTDELNDARQRLRGAIGSAGAAAVAGSVGNFEMMNRVLDATGVPVPGSMADIEQSLRSN